MRADRIREVADMIDAAGQDFNMRHWNSCVYGHTCVSKLKHGDYPLFNDRINTVADYFEVSYREAMELCMPRSSSYFNRFSGKRWSATGHEVAKVLRHLATTGILDWERAFAADPSLLETVHMRTPLPYDNVSDVHELV